MPFLVCCCKIMASQTACSFLSAGASLSQDRGRLESKIETLNMEVVSLKRELHVNISFTIIFTQFAS